MDRNNRYVGLHQAPQVALYARAWIEIVVAKCGQKPASVALYARAWIEIMPRLGRG